MTTKRVLEISGKQEYKKMVKFTLLRSRQSTVTEGLITEYQTRSISTNRRAEYSTLIGKKAKEF
jgi:hypothetical protein